MIFYQFYLNLNFILNNMLILIFILWIFLMVLILRLFAVSKDLDKEIAKHPKSKKKPD